MNNTIKSNLINFQHIDEQREEGRGYSDYNQYVYDDEGYGEEGEFIFDDEDEEQEQVDYAETPAGFVEEEEGEQDDGEDGSSTYSQSGGGRIADEDVDEEEEEEDVEERHPYIDWLLDVGLDPWAQNDWALAEEFFAMQNRHGENGEEDSDEGDVYEQSNQVEEADISKEEECQTREVEGKQKISSQSDVQSKEDQIQMQQEDEKMQDIFNTISDTSSCVVVNPTM